MAAKKKVKKKVVVKKRSKLNYAIAGLIINLVLLTGIGSIIAGKTKEGLAQFAIVIIALVLMFRTTTPIGLPLLIANWVWGMITGIRAIQQSA